MRGSTTETANLPSTLRFDQMNCGLQREDFLNFYWVMIDVGNAVSSLNFLKRNKTIGKFCNKEQIISINIVAKVLLPFHCSPDPNVMGPLALKDNLYSLTQCSNPKESN